MKIIGILSWYDERVDDLAGTVSAFLHKAQIDHLIAVDGAYAAYPNGQPYSNSQQASTIAKICRSLEVGYTIDTPREPWFGNEVEKRNHAFRLAEVFAEEGDWYFLNDADHLVRSAIGYRERLVEAEEDVAEVHFTEKMDGSFDMGGCPLRCIFRAVPGLRFDVNHFTYRLPDGRNLHDPSEPALSLPMIEVEHLTQWRDSWRKESQQTYYRRRDQLGLELREVVDAA